MKPVHQNIVNRLQTSTKGNTLLVSAFLTGAVLLTGCQSTGFSQSNVVSEQQTSAAAKSALATALDKQRLQSFSYHSNIEINNDQQTVNEDIDNSGTGTIDSGYVYSYCDDTHDQAYIALIMQAEKEYKDVMETEFDAERTVIEQDYQACEKAFDAWNESRYDSDVVVPEEYQTLFDNYDERTTLLDIKEAKLLDAYLLKPLSLNAQGIYQPLAGKATMLASAQYQARNHRSSINQPVYVDFFKGDIYLWADNFALANSELLDETLGTKWQNKWLKIALDDGTLPEGFGKEVIKIHFAAMDEVFAAAPVSQFDYVAPDTLASLTPKLPAHQLPNMLESEQIIRRVESTADYKRSYQDYMGIFYERIAQQYPELVESSMDDEVDATQSDNFTSKALVQQALAILKHGVDRDAGVDEEEQSATEVQTLYGFDARDQLQWQHLRSEFPSETDKNKGMVMDALQQYADISGQEVAFPNLPSDLQVPNPDNSVDVREYGEELLQHYRDGNGTSMGKMLFNMLPVTPEQFGAID
ncbi:hypothetical protein [Psychrobacter sp.]|uniref:hypothetical protein n=1 Tax=Psychrobacter sp. TaxID=56811 RepID=UPI002647F756|nr:hypothetical protein [Psychrobacter sp.]MDN6275645.1 hypothetical protein [Psychrobacter sp.]MDN6307466.1 hypothetical protein [Psychrobacter sp.]